MKEERFTSKYTPTKLHAKYTPLSFSTGDMGTFRVGQGPGDGGVPRPGGEEELWGVHELPHFFYGCEKENPAAVLERSLWEAGDDPILELQRYGADLAPQ